MRLKLKSFDMKSYGKFYSRMSNSEIDKITVNQLRNNLVNSVKMYENLPDTKFFNITDPKMHELIISTYSNVLNRKALAYAVSRPYTIMEIIFQFNDPQTTIYRKVANLIKNGFLIQVDSGRKENSRKTDRFMSTFKTVHFDILEDGNMDVKVQFSDALKNYNAPYLNMNHKNSNYNL